MENLKSKKSDEDPQKITSNSENVLLIKKLKIASSLIGELKSKIVILDDNKEKQTEKINNLNLKHQEKKINLQKEIFNSVDDISDLKNKFNDLKRTLKDLQDEIDCKDKIITELTQEKDIPNHSCNSLANELELAD